MLVVIGGHLLLAIFIATSRSMLVRLRESDVPPRLEVRVVVIPAPSSQTSAAVGRRRATSTDPRRFVVPDQPLGETPQLGPSALSIDWYGDGQRAAEAAAHAQTRREGVDCDEVETPGSMRPRCVKSSHFEWHPNPKMVEFEGLLPYVHLGKRCVLGLGFFGCAVGKLPDANWHLLDDMKDPDRLRSSVPDSPR